MIEPDREKRRSSAGSGWMVGLVGGGLVAMGVLALAAWLGVASISIESERHQAEQVVKEFRSGILRIDERLRALEALAKQGKDGEISVGPLAQPVQIAGMWTDGGANCLRISEGTRDGEFLAKVWICAAGEPEAAVTVSADLAGSHFFADRKRRLAMRILSGELIVASFHYPPPDHRHVNFHVLFRKHQSRPRQSESKDDSPRAQGETNRAR